MIIRNKPGLYEILFAMRGTMLPRIRGRMALIAVATIVAVAAAHGHPGIFAQIGAFPFTLIGLALSIFMSFRNNACYDRWWEGRRQWGALVTTGRSLARLAQGLPPPARERLLTGVCAFAAGLAVALRQNRDVATQAAISAWWGMGPWQQAANPVNGVTHELGTLVLAERQAGTLDPLHWRMIEGELAALTGIQAACERIAATPVPFGYSLLLHRTAYVFCLCLPFALAGGLGWWTLLPALLVGYTFFGLDALGDQLEEPFGTEPNDLPIDALVRVIERDALSALGRRDLPPLLGPVEHVLL